MYVTLHLMLLELGACVCVRACVIRLFIDAVKSFVVQRDTNPGHLRPGLVLAGSDTLWLPTFPVKT